MAQNVSDTWKTLWKTRGTVMEYGFDIAGTWYGPGNEVTHSYDNGLYESFSIGNAATAHITVSLYADNIPRGATVRRYIRLKNGAMVSEWLPKGTFFTNRRSEDDGYWTVEAYDAMRKAEVPWNPDMEKENWPMPVEEAVTRFASIMGVEVDPRTKLNPSYMVDMPTTDPESSEPVNNNYSIRQELQWIAAGHCGNWIITDDGKLLLVPLFSIPEETSCLVTENGEAIVLGGVAIYVGK